MWLRLPVVIRATLIGAAVAAAGTLPWAVLVSINTRRASTLPWAVPIMALYLWVFWRYFARGQGSPRSTAEVRRVNARSNPPSPDAWGPALLAGLLGLGSVLLLQDLRA